MANKKRIPLKPHMLKKNISHRQLQINYGIAKKMLQHFELAPELIDAFSKKQRQILLGNMFELPSIKSEIENTIPRQYQEIFRTEINHYLKNNFWGNAENKLTYMELATYGIPFFFLIRIMMEQDAYKNTPQQEIAQLIYDRFSENDMFSLIFQTSFAEVYLFVQSLMRKYSQINFRQYGFRYSWAGEGTDNRLKIRFTVNNCEIKIFKYKGIERKAYRLISPPNGMVEGYNVTIAKNLIIPDAKEEHYFNIYIQSHVLHRFKERVDIFYPSDRNLLIHYTLISDLKVVSSEKQKFLACNIKNVDGESFPIGYFTFFLQQNDLVINTFLPLANENTPEGEKLYRIFPLNKEDMIYLGMDKVSFYLQVDFDQIPILKQALIDSGIWKTKEVFSESAKILSVKTDKEINPVEEQRTLFVKHFFDKLEQLQNVIE